MSTTTTTTTRPVDATDAKNRAPVDTPEGPGLLVYVPIPGGVRRGPSRSSRPRKCCVRVGTRHVYCDPEQLVTSWPRPGQAVKVRGVEPGQALTGVFHESDDVSVTVLSDSGRLLRMPRHLVGSIEVRS